MSNVLRFYRGISRGRNFFFYSVTESSHRWKSGCNTKHLHNSNP